jgi:hypothetical protein
VVVILLMPLKKFVKYSPAGTVKEAHPELALFKAPVYPALKLTICPEYGAVHTGPLIISYIWIQRPVPSSFVKLVVTCDRI